MTLIHFTCTYPWPWRKLTYIWTLTLTWFQFDLISTWPNPWRWLELILIWFRKWSNYKKNPWPLLDLYSLMTITEFWPWPYLTFLDIELVSPCTCPSIHWPPWGSFWGRCPCLWDSRTDGASWRCAPPWSMGLFPACPHTSRSVKQKAMIPNFFFNDKLWLFKIPHYLNSKTSFSVTCLFESIRHCRKKYITVIMNTYITYLLIYIWYKIYPIPYLTCLLPSILGTCNILLHLHACYTQVLTHISMFHLP